MDIKVQLIRTTDNGVQTIGKLYVSGDQHATFDTLERPFKNNERGVSCIPSGRYICSKLNPTEAIPYPHIAVHNVSGREGIRIHSGNLYSHSRGCILIGKGYADINKDGQSDVLQSKQSLIELMNVLPDEFTLHITEAITVTKKPILNV